MHEEKFTISEKIIMNIILRSNLQGVVDVPRVFIGENNGRLFSPFTTPKKSFISIECVVKCEKKNIEIEQIEEIVS